MKELLEKVGVCVFERGIHRNFSLNSTDLENTWKWPGILP